MTAAAEITLSPAAVPSSIYRCPYALVFFVFPSTTPLKVSRKQVAMIMINSFMMAVPVLMLLWDPLPDGGRPWVLPSASHSSRKKKQEQKRKSRQTSHVSQRHSHSHSRTMHNAEMKKLLRD